MAVTRSTAAERRQRQPSSHPIPGLRPAGRNQETVLLGGGLTVVLLGLLLVYLAAAKDRLYCDKADSPRRRRTQQTLHTLTDGLCRLLAPVLCHTADEAYRALGKVEQNDTTRCVHLETLLPPTGVAADPGYRIVRVQFRNPVPLDEGFARIESLIAAAGRKNVIGKPILYKTTKEFLIQFGLKDIGELPSLKEFEEILRMAFGDSEAPAAQPLEAAEAAPPPAPEAQADGAAPAEVPQAAEPEPEA